MHAKGMRKQMADLPRADYEWLNVNRPIPFRIHRVNAGNPMQWPTGDHRGQLSPDTAF